MVAHCSHNFNYCRDGYIWYNQVMILKKKALLAILITFFLIIIFLWFNFYNGIFAPYITIYSPNFTFEKFYNIKNGTSREEVRQILGEPFGDRFGNTCDWFSKTDNIRNIFFGFEVVLVCYDKDHKVNFRSSGTIY